MGAAADIVGGARYVNWQRGAHGLLGFKNYFDADPLNRLLKKKR